jgi:hypothetical protein
MDTPRRPNTHAGTHARAHITTHTHRLSSLHSHEIHICVYYVLCIVSAARGPITDLPIRMYHIVLLPTNDYNVPHVCQLRRGYVMVERDRRTAQCSPFGQNLPFALGYNFPLAFGQNLQLGRGQNLPLALGGSLSLVLRQNLPLMPYQLSPRARQNY